MLMNRKNPKAQRFSPWPHREGR